MSRKWKYCSFVLVLMAAVAPIVISNFGFVIFLMGSQDEGSPRYAKRWKSNFATVDSPQVAKSQFDDVGVKQFENGDWVLIVSADSHSSFWGGTVVTKDSTGRVRAFFGHVCGHGAMVPFSNAKSLDEYFADPRWSAFYEYSFPAE
jgi:hypothetical protein